MTKKIRNLADIRNLFRKIDTPIIGIGVTAFNRIGLEDMIPNYRIVCLRYSLNTQLIEKDIPILSLEKEIAPEHLLRRRNSTTVLKHRKTQACLKSFKKKPALLFYKVSSQIEEICQRSNWIMIANPKRYGKETIENKIKFRKILEECGVPSIPGEVTDFFKIEFKDLAKKYELPFVIQHPTKGGGKGTFFIKNEEDFENLKMEKRDQFKETEVIVAKFVKGPSPSLTGCVTRYGIVYTSLQYQLLDIPELFSPEKGSGLFCGHDWSASDFSKEVSDQAYSYTRKIGEYFKKIGYQGIFGLDMIVDKKTGQLYVVECNPRLLGSFPVLPMVQIRNNEIPLLALHVLEFLDVDYEIDVEEINRMVQQKKQGAQIIMHNLEGVPAKTTLELKAGVYKIKDNKLVYQRAGYALRHLIDKEEFLITDGVPQKGSRYSKNGRIMRILTLGKVLDSYKKLNPWARNVAVMVYQSLGLEPQTIWERLRPRNILRKIYKRLI